MPIDVKQLLENIGLMDYYEVVVELDGPMEFKGVVPFDMTIADGVATFKVLASSYDEAVQRVDQYMTDK